MRYAFFPGCVLNDTAKEVSMATKHVAKALGIELIEIEGWACCGLGHTQDVNETLAHTINAHTIAKAKLMDVKKIMTVCNTCTVMLRKTKQSLDKDENLKANINKTLSKRSVTYDGSVQITHLLWALIEDVGLDGLKAKIKRPLTGLKVANYYGCHIIMPPKTMTFENFRNPNSLESLVEALGATNIKYKDRLACCGFHAMPQGAKEVLKMTNCRTKSAKDSGAHIIVTPCPLCQIQLDAHQETATSVTHVSDDLIPIIHVPQLVGLALGIAPIELGLNKHTINALPILKDILQEEESWTS